MTENPPQPTEPPTPESAPPPAYGYSAPPPATPPYPQQPYGQQPYPPQYAPPPAPGVLSPSEERTWAGAAHWSALVASLVGLSFLGPLVIMVTQGNKSPFVRRHAVESLNFQLSILIYVIVSAILILVIIGFFLLIGVGLMWLILTIMATIKASNGEDYRYPMTIRMVS